MFFLIVTKMVLLTFVAIILMYFLMAIKYFAQHYFQVEFIHIVIIIIVLPAQ